MKLEALKPVLLRGKERPPTALVGGTEGGNFFFVCLSRSYATYQDHLRDPTLSPQLADFH